MSAEQEEEQVTRDTVSDGSELPAETEDVGTLFQAAVDRRGVDVYSNDGQVIARNADWVRPVENDPRRLIVGDLSGNICEIIVSGDGNPLAVYRLESEDRWLEYEPHTHEEGINDAIYLPSEPDYQALRERRMEAGDTTPPWKGTILSTGVSDTYEERIGVKEEVECDLCETDRDAEIRVVAWSGKAILGKPITDEKVENELCIECLDLFPDSESIEQYRSPEDAGEFPINFADVSDHTREIERDSKTRRWDHFGGRKETEKEHTTDPETIDVEDVRMCHLDSEPVGRLWTNDRVWDGVFTVYCVEENVEEEDEEPRHRYHLVAELHHNTDPVEVETAEITAEGVSEVFRQARHVYESFWSGPSETRDLDLSVKRRERR